jgi:hypothetical protein
MLVAALSLLLATAFPSSSRTSWMTPESFRLVIGMPYEEAAKALGDSGWVMKPGRHENEYVVDYTEDKAMTLEFRKNRLRSVRFELFALIPDIRKAFTEQRELLRRRHGSPKKIANAKSVVIYDDRLPNIMVVLSDDPKTEYGKKGVGFLAVRYFDPSAVSH